MFFYLRARSPAPRRPLMVAFPRIPDRIQSFQRRPQIDLGSVFKLPLSVLKFGGICEWKRWYYGGNDGFCGQYPLIMNVLCMKKEVSFMDGVYQVMVEVAEFLEVLTQAEIFMWMPWFRSRSDVPGYGWGCRIPRGFNSGRDFYVNAVIPEPVGRTRLWLRLQNS